MTTAAAITRPDPLASLDALPSISLSDLQTEAAFLTRCDRKYLVPINAARLLLPEVDSATRVLEIEGRRAFGYLSPYFDDSGHAAYLAAARRRPGRFKVRTRRYTDTGLSLLEVKVRDARGRTVKHRRERDATSLVCLTADERHWLGTFPQVAPLATALAHCLTTSYRRTTLVLPDGAGRVTLDRGLVFSLPTGEAHALPGWLVVETKGTGGPTALDRILWRHGHRPESMSKFAFGLSLLLPDLPSNHWHRLRTRLASAATEDWPQRRR